MPGVLAMVQRMCAVSGTAVGGYSLAPAVTARSFIHFEHHQEGKAMQRDDVIPSTPNTLVSADSTSALVDRLAGVLKATIPITNELDDATSKVRSAYRDVAEVVIELRHRFPGPNGEACDLRGRSKEYRVAVREAYNSAGIDPTTRIARRVTVGVAYWVRNLLLERYTRDELVRLGVIERSARQSWRLACGATQSPDDVMSIAVGILNELATDSSYLPPSQVMSSLLRALSILKIRLEKTRMDEETLDEKQLGGTPITSLAGVA
jgi:hypothetical protein